jgi:hypothetical protein
MFVKENLLNITAAAVTAALLIGGIYHYYDICVAITKFFAL